MSENYKQLKVKELQDLLEKNGLVQTGKKDELIERLVSFDKRKELEKLEKELDLDVFEDDKVYKPVDMLKESVLSDDEDLLTDKPFEPEPPAAFKFTPITFEKPSVKKLSAEDQRRLDAQRRLERMKRFGVKASEEELKKLRAARFGAVIQEATKAIEKPEPKKDNKRKFKKPIQKTTQKAIQKPIQRNDKFRNKFQKSNKSQLNQAVAQIQQKKNKLVSTVKPNRTVKQNNGRVITFSNQTVKIPAVQKNTNKRFAQITNAKRKVYIQQENTNTRFRKRKS